MQILFYGNSALGNSLLYISLSSVDFGRVRPIQGRTLFFVLLLIFEPMASSHILQIFLRVTVQNQIRMPNGSL